MVEALRSGRIAGFCAGAPWGEIAERAGVGVTVATSSDIWRNGPGKALAVRERWSEANPEALAGLLRALYRAARFCDAPANVDLCRGAALATRLARVDSHAILSVAAGRFGRATGPGFTPMPRPIRGARMRSGSWRRCGAGG